MDMIEEFAVDQVKPGDLNDVLMFYKHCSYGGGAKQDDLIFCIRKERKIIAVARLCHENQTLVLRGMQVEKQFQRRGIGKTLLYRLDKAIGDKTCYCIPYGHLEKFYALIGFMEIDNKEAPGHLSERLKKYQLKDPSLIIMKRP